MARSGLKCFFREARRAKLGSRVDRGVQTVPVEQVTGSVGRCWDFTRRFKVRSRHHRFAMRGRIGRIEQALKEGKELPPIELYQVGREYYVLDGHHRLHMMREQGRTFADAHVTEYLPMAGTPERALADRRITFSRETKLRGTQEIRLSEPLSYDLLRDQIAGYAQAHGTEDDATAAEWASCAREWYERVCYPAKQRLGELSLVKSLPSGRTVDDLYVHLCEQFDLWYRAHGVGPVPVEEALKVWYLGDSPLPGRRQRRRLRRRLENTIRPCFWQGVCPVEAKRGV